MIHRFHYWQDDEHGMRRNSNENQHSDRTFYRQVFFQIRYDQKKNQFYRVHASVPPRRDLYYDCNVYIIIYTYDIIPIKDVEIEAFVDKTVFFCLYFFYLEPRTQLSHRINSTWFADGE